VNLLTLEKNRLFDYLENIKSENLGLSFSFLLHSLLLLVAIGLPNFFDPKPSSIPTIIPIEIIYVTENTTVIQKENNDTNLLEEKQKNVDEKKFNSLDTHEIQNVDEKKFNSSDTHAIQKVDIKDKPKIKMKTIANKETTKQNIVIKEKNEVPIKLEKETIKIDTNQVVSLPKKPIKPKLTSKAKPTIEKPESQQDVQVKAKLKPKPEPEFDIASIQSSLKDIRNEETITSGEKKIENKEEAIEDVKNKINKDPDLENAAKISIGNSIVQQMRRCWRVNSKKFNTSFEEAQYVIAEAEYNKNGSIIEGSVHIIDTNVPEDSLLISDVLYALYNCRLDLPAEYYYLWEKNKIRFDPDFENKQSEKQINMNLFN